MSIFLESNDSLNNEDEQKVKKKFIGHPSNDIELLLEEFDCKDAIQKMKDNDMDQQQFWDLNKSEFTSLLGIKIYGRIEKLAKKFNKIKKEHNKVMEKKY
jgi:hypothetical protein